MKVPPNPFLQPVYFDSCAFDGGDTTEQQASIEARMVFEVNDGTINILHSVQKEINYPANPFIPPFHSPLYKKKGVCVGANDTFLPYFEILTILLMPFYFVF